MEEYSYYDKPNKPVKKSDGSKGKLVKKVFLYVLYTILVASIVFLSVWGLGLAVGAQFAADIREEFNSLIGAQYYSSVDIYIYLLLILSTAILVSVLLIRDNNSKKKKKVEHRY